ncbi:MULTISPECIES: hypothetical protein [Staphylococcus]|jgi:hypothetical protein|nr:MULTISPECIES: hypothetical protein [Staphylococcus]TBW75730.1 hypothetical protein EQ810_13035 [Staphylococcus warneri]MBC8781626.1 hypothetical protein [Staphylococcus capitis]MBM0787204.1 hypothetical protein [Staphylococcus epidermidis]MBM0838426.1 hypothetical protein [Staphylococcus epidermidis]MBM0873466.1 hypothetical protein [Staphylococcus epidermidis]
MEKLINWLLPVLIIVVVLAIQYFISYHKGGVWKLLVPIVFTITLLVLFFLEKITIGSLIIYFIIGNLALLGQSFPSEKNNT